MYNPAALLDKHKTKNIFFHLKHTSDKIKRRQGTALCFEMFEYNVRNILWNFFVQLYLKNNREKHQEIDVFSFAGKYLVQPFPLEWNSNLYENCNDPCEVNVTHNLGRKRRKHENNSTILIEPSYPRETAQAIPRQLIMSDQHYAPQ